MANKNIRSLDAYLKKGAISIYYIYATISCVGYFIDIVNFYASTKRVFYNNLLTISLTIISFLFYYFKKISLKTSFGIFLYAAVANVFIDTLTDLYSANRLYFFLRDSLFIIFVLTLASLLVRKIHSLIVAVLYLGIAIILAQTTKNVFLNDSMYLIFIFISAYSVAVYHFVGAIEKSILEHECNTQIIKEQNEIVNETNTILEERQQQIEEQSEELTRQTEVLKYQTDQLAVKNKELEVLSKTKDKFLSILAHDLKGPFHLIMGFSGVLEKDFDKLDDTKKKHFINLLSTTSQKTFNLFENLLTWARSQSDTLAYKPQKIAVNGLIRENLVLFKENYRSKKVEIVENIQTDCFVKADENMLHAVIRNLLSNAIKFTSEGGQIYVKCLQNNNNILVEIRDTGAGMNTETVNSLFLIDKPRTTGTSGEVGSGLGLLICKDFIEKNGGSIWVNSEINKGSTFSFSLPVADNH